RKDVESRLRRNRIKLLAADENVPGMPLLYLRITVIAIDTETYGFTYELALQQQVALARDPNFSMWAATWQTSKLGYGASGTVTSFIKEHVGNAIDMFCKEYLGAN